MPIHFCWAQYDSATYCVAFYNVENLFDTYVDSLTFDHDFTPTGTYHWTYKKYFKKINNISKVLLAIGEGNPPALVGMAEIENERVLHHLCKQSPLKKFNYNFVHYNSPDRRGIDVALIYRTEWVKIIHSEPLQIIFPFDTSSRNRDVLYVVIRLISGDTLHLFVNHWTSRYGGYAATVPKRNYYASVVKTKCNELLSQNPQTNILVMGDFNDYPDNESVLQLTSSPYPLYNLMSRFVNMSHVGTHKHEDFWGCLDQMLVSSSLRQLNTLLAIQYGQAEIFSSDFMLEHDEKYGGYKVYRTFLGPRYIGGYSDHLPIFLRLHSFRNSNPQ